MYPRGNCFCLLRLKIKKKSHFRQVNQSIIELHQLAGEKRDNHMTQFLDEFLDEQVNAGLNVQGRGYFAKFIACMFYVAYIAGDI